MIRINHRLLMIMMGIGITSPILANAQFKNNSGAVFVMTNDAGKNEVIAYGRTTDGILQGEERYLTGGRGSGGATDPLESQGSLTLSEDKSLLFAVNAGSGDVSVFGVQGPHLVLLDREASGGSEPVAVAQHDNLVYVLNSGGAGSVDGFTLGAGGRLRAIKNANAYLTANVTGGASLAFSPDGQFLVVTERLSNKFDVFHVLPNGTLAPVVVNPSPNPGLFSATFSPLGALIVSETGPTGADNGSTISSYSIEASGQLAPISAAIPTFGTANCWNAVTPDGKRVYVSNAGSASISGFNIASNGTLTPIDNTVVGNNPEGATNLDIAISANGKFLYSLNSATGAIGVFAIQQNGNLESLGQSGDLPKSSGMNGIAAL